METPKKIGRPARPYVASDGRHINGLRRRSNGRWILADGRTFREPDEAKALQTFWEMTGEMVEFPDGSTAARAEVERLRNELNDLMEGNEREFWQRVATEIRERPKYVAEMTGIEEIGYLKNLKEPEVLPSLDELEQLWKDHYAGSKEEMKKVLKSWKDFRNVTKVVALPEITTKVGLLYKDDVLSRGNKPKSIRHLFSGVRRFLQFFIDERPTAPKAVGEAKLELAVLKLKRTKKTVNPKPIEKDDWDKLLKAASGMDKALILMMLNCGMYVKEAIRVQWSEIKNGCLVTNRHKTGEQIRAAVLWKETIEALEQLPKNGTHIFLTYQGKPFKACGAHRRFIELKKAAKVDVTGSQLRDGAYTVAIEAGVSFKLCEILVGHSSGMADNYVARRPQMVKPACDAIYDYYMNKAK